MLPTNHITNEKIIRYKKTVVEKFHTSSQRLCLGNTDKTNNVCINIIMWCFRLIIVAVKKQ